jgi:anti-sigma factor RsiW
MTCPTPESLVPHALGEADLTISRHVESCAVCQAELARLQEGVGLLRAGTAFQRRTVTPDCLEESTIASFVDGRLTPEERAPLVAHLLTCGNCRSVVRAAGRLLADDAVTREIPRTVERPWRRWSLPLGAAAAATLLLFLWPRSTERTDPIPGLREPPVMSTAAPVPISPRESVARVDRFVWSSMAGVDRFRLRLYDDEGTLLWTMETADTVAALPDSVALPAPDTYFWKVEAQTEWGRWATSDLVDFRLGGGKR